MSLLRTSSAVARARPLLPLELLTYSFHTTAVQQRDGDHQRGASPKQRSSSRTRLVKDLKPKASFGKKRTGHLEVAPRAPKAPFKRNGPPHSPRPKFGGPPKKFTSTRPRDSEREWRPIRGGDAKPTRPPPKFSRDSKQWTPSRHPPKFKNLDPVVDEFDRSTKPEPASSLPSEFTSPPLMEGLLDSVRDILGDGAKPTPIQALSIKHLVTATTKSHSREYLLASETGSGKSLAYMLPMLQNLKSSELDASSARNGSTQSADPQRLINPRAIVLAPTHELSRQLSATAKSLSHNIKLRVVCASQSNTSLSSSKHVSAAKMAALGAADSSTEQPAVQATPRPVDILVGTTSKILEMVRGHGWNWDKVLEETKTRDPKQGKKKEFVIGEPQVSLERVEWVIVDEADVLLDPDFRDSTQLLLADVAAARGQPVPESASANGPIDYPFNFVLTSATIPSALATYLDTHHPNLTRLASPNLHRLPSTLKMLHAAWTSGNHAADVEARIRQTWHADTTHGSGVRSKILIFCNKSTKVELYGKYLAEKGIPNVALTSTADTRNKGNNRHLQGFLRTPLNKQSPKDAANAGKKTSDDEEPQVLITTSLLSRGLDFSPDIKNVLIVDPPRNMIDFLHRAGRTGRAGSRGTVTIFGKTKGRGAEKDKEVRKTVNALAA